MARVLFINLPAEGHINPTLGLVKQLVDNGEEVVYLCTEEFREKISQTGAQFKPYQMNEQAIAAVGVDPTNVKHPLQFTEFIVRGIIEPHVPEILKLTEKESFDYLIFDSLFSWGGYLLGEKLGIPSICSVTHFVMTKVPDFDQEAEADSGLDVDAMRIRISEVLQRIADKYNVDVPSPEYVNRTIGKYKLVFTSRYFQPESEQFDEDFIFTGPSITNRLDAPSFPLEQLRTQYDKVVYISMGSILNKDLEFYKLCFEAFRDVPAQFVLSSGKDTDIESLRDRIPNNFIIKPYVPQLEVLQHTDVFITHAGMNSTSEALYYNVPLVTIPLSSDQPLVANRVAELGAGITLDKTKLTPNTLKTALLQVLNDSNYKENAARIGDSFREAGGYQAAAKRIMSLFSKV